MLRKLIITITIYVLVIFFAHFFAAATENFSNYEDGFDSGLISLDSDSDSEQIPLNLNIPPELITKKLKKFDPKFAISAESVLRKIKNKEEIVLIDVRNGEEFEKFRVPGSINIPLFAIKTKVFLKSKPLILVNEGYNYARLEQECKQLRESGFTELWVLNGGLNVWKQKGGPLAGDIFIQKKLNKIPPQIFFEEKNNENCLVIDVSRTKNSEAQYLIPQTVVIPLVDNNEEFVSKIRKATDELKGNSFSSILIFNQKGKQYEKVEKLIQKTGLKNVFYLKDGLNGYKIFLQRQVLIWQSNNYSKKMLKKCTKCP